jgi:hypothetical protein
LQHADDDKDACIILLSRPLDWNEAQRVKSMFGKDSESIRNIRDAIRNKRIDEAKTLLAALESASREPKTRLFIDVAKEGVEGDSAAIFP